MFRSFLAKLRVTKSPTLLPSQTQPVAQTSSEDRTQHKELRSLGLLDLPPEIRLIIYKMCLVQYGKSTLRSPEMMLRTELLYDLKSPPEANIQLFENAILRVCRKFNKEATPVFYSSNRFHHSLSCNPLGGADMLEFSNKKILRTLQHMKHISLDIYQLADSPIGPHGFNISANRLLSKFLDEIRGRCGESLRSLEIQLLCKDRGRRGLTPLLSERSTSSAIRNMQAHLQSLTITGYRFPWTRDHSVLVEFCLNIAPNHMWKRDGI